MSLHNDLATWAGRARRNGQDRIYLDLETAEAIVEQITRMATTIEDLKTQDRGLRVRLRNSEPRRPWWHWSRQP